MARLRVPASPRVAKKKDCQAVVVNEMEENKISHCSASQAKPQAPEPDKANPMRPKYSPRASAPVYLDHDEHNSKEATLSNACLRTPMRGNVKMLDTLSYAA